MLRKQVNEVALDAAVRGSLVATNALGNASDPPRWMILLLEQAQAWPVRLRAAEILRDFASGTLLYAHERSRVLRRLKQLAQRAESVALTDEDHQKLLGTDPDRDISVSWVPQYGLDDWLLSVVGKVREYPYEESQ